MLYVVKRDGREVRFNSDKIANAIKKAAKEIEYNLRESQVLDIVQKAINYIEKHPVQRSIQLLKRLTAKL